NSADPVTADDEVAYDALWQEVRAWLVTRYQGYDIDLNAALPQKLILTTEASAWTDRNSTIHFSVLYPSAVVGVASEMMHESLHALQAYIERQTGVQVTGASVEGQAESGAV